MPPPCPRLISIGSCTDPLCKYKHNIHICVPCGVVSQSDRARNAHLNGTRHRRRVQSGSQTLRCPLCEAMIPGSSNWKSHIKGKRHTSVAKMMGVSPNVDPEEGGGEVHGHVYCTVCETYVHEEGWSRHPQTRLHNLRVRFGSLQSAFEEASKDKHGVTVSSAEGVDFGVLDDSKPSSTVEATLDLRTTTPLSSIELVEARLPTKTLGRLSHFSLVPRTYPTKLVYGRTTPVTVNFSRNQLGVYEDRVELIFKDTKIGQQFAIVRVLKAIVAGPEWSDLQPKAPFVPRKRASRDREANDVVPGDPPPASGAIPYVVKLPLNLIPDHIKKILASSGFLANTIKHFRSSILPSSLQDTTYGRHFKALLWAEEYRSEQDLQVYDIDRTTLSRHNSYYYLEVPGLAEKRPSVLVGDSILVQPLGYTDTERWFEGCVHVLRKEEVGMRFGRGFPAHSPTLVYRVRFRLNRYPLRRQHQALDTVLSPARLLFPTAAHVLNAETRPQPGAGVVMYNKQIGTNIPQLQAVTSIVNLPKGSPPFVIFGPPGTGKTITVVEAIRQVLYRNPNAKVLACAPSNSAADIIAERLTMLGPVALFRFYAPSRSKV